MNTVLGPAVVVERDVWEAVAPLLWMVRDMPSEPSDSGWTLGSSQEPSDWVVVSLAEMMDREPGLELVLARPVGTRIWRTNIHEAWRV